MSVPSPNECKMPRDAIGLCEYTKKHSRKAWGGDVLWQNVAAPELTGLEDFGVATHPKSNNSFRRVRVRGNPLRSGRRLLELRAFSLRPFLKDVPWCNGNTSGFMYWSIV